MSLANLHMQLPNEIKTAYKHVSLLSINKKKKTKKKNFFLVRLEKELQAGKKILEEKNKETSPPPLCKYG